MPSRILAYRATIGLIWALALWHSWICRGLFIDGSAFLVNIVHYEQFFEFYPPRAYAMIAAQVPVVAGIKLGITDLHQLGRLFSLGLFALPTVLYTLALVRARHDAVVLAIVITAIGGVFMTTSFFIIGEYNTAYALAILVAVWLVTAERLTVGDGLVLLAAAAFSIRTYEVFIYLGPLLAAMTLWQVRRVERRPVVPMLLYLGAAACFIAGMAVAIDSVVHPYSATHLAETYDMALDFWQNLQFDFAFVAMLIVAIWALVRPEQLATLRPYRWSAIFAVLLALSPLLALADTVVRPLAKSHYVARTVCGLVIAAMVVFLWCHAARMFENWRLRRVLRDEGTRRRVLGLACLILLAILPSDIFLSLTWQSYIGSLRQVVTTHTGLVAYEETPLAHRPDLLLVENWALPSQSLILRSRPGDGIVRPPRDFSDWLPFPLDNPPDLGRFVWRD
ncbi:MAG: hypothetical protein JSR91_15540 [Proteobacteria bacterium]|nr:hypothetical protein [Pseudomonadota bacterium]